MKPRCDYCKFGSYFEDMSVGIFGYYECGADQIEDEFEVIIEDAMAGGMDYETAIGMYCTYYEPIIVDICGYCHGKMGIPVHDVKYWGVNMYYEYPVCSKECEDASLAETKDLEEELERGQE